MAPRTPKDTEKKAAKPAKTAAKAKAPAAANAELKVVAPAPSQTAEKTVGALKLKELIDTVASATGGKKPEVKKTVEATLAALAKALGAGKALTVPPLGKLRVVKTKGPALTLKLRVTEGAKGAGLALADDGEDG